jgi:anti-sigma regulatory factor (Ser/Thr protein kinase)
MTWQPTRELIPAVVRARLWRRPEASGDAFLIVTLPRGGVLIVALDAAGHGVEQVPKVRYLEGWVRGWVRGLSVVPRIESFADDLNAELLATRLEAAWFAAILSPRHASPHLVAYQGMTRRSPAPLLLVGAPPSTLPSVGRDDEPVRHDLWPPWRLAIASDGLLRRLGGGDEPRGKASLLEWQTGATRDRVLRDQLETKVPLADDELYADMTWQRWDGVQQLDIHDDAERHRLKRRLRQEIGAGPDASRELGVAVGEALKNVMKHAYGQEGGRVSVSWRDEGEHVRVEVEDAGIGAVPFREGGGFKVMRVHADGMDLRRLYPHGTVVSLTKRKDNSDDKP